MDGWKDKEVLVSDGGEDKRLALDDSYGENLWMTWKDAYLVKYGEEW
jgi:hypothetical protein